MNLFRAVKLPPARKVETEVGALPDDRRLTKSLREEHMEVGKGMLAASRRCCILRPDGPAADPFGNVCRTPRMLKSGPMDIGTVGTWGTCGGGQLGCLKSNSFHVLSLFGAMPAERRMPQAFPNIPALANEIAESINLCGSSAETCLPRKWEVFPFVRFHRRPNSLSDQSLHRVSMDVGLRFLPLRLEDGRTHFGNINSLRMVDSDWKLREGNLPLPRRS